MRHCAHLACWQRCRSCLGAPQRSEPPFPALRLVQALHEICQLVQPPWPPAAAEPCDRLWTHGGWQDRPEPQQRDLRMMKQVSQACVSACLLLPNAQHPCAIHAPPRTCQLPRRLRVGVGNVKAEAGVERCAHRIRWRRFYAALTIEHSACRLPSTCCEVHCEPGCNGQSAPPLYRSFASISLHRPKSQTVMMRQVACRKTTCTLARAMPTGDSRTSAIMHDKPDTHHLYIY